MAQIVFTVASLLCVCAVYVCGDTSHNVAFSAGLSNTQHVYDEETIMYDRVFVNEHYGYDPNTGVFSCPVAGIYVFHFHAYNTNKDSIMWLDLLHNDVIQVSLSGYNSHTVGSNTVMLKLAVNDHVQVVSKEQQTFSLFGLNDQVYSTFSGYILHEITHAYADSGPMTPIVG